MAPCAVSSPTALASYLHVRDGVVPRRMPRRGATGKAEDAPLTHHPGRPTVVRFRCDRLGWAAPLPRPLLCASAADWTLAKAVKAEFRILNSGHHSCLVVQYSSSTRGRMRKEVSTSCNTVG